MQKNISIRRSAQKLAKAGQLAKAIDTYLPILEADADPYDHLYVGDMCVKAGRAQEAVQHYEAAIEQYRKLGFHRNAVALCRKILRLDPGHYDIHRRLGQLFAADELIGDALESYQTYLSRVPENNRANKVFGQAIEHACELALKRTELALRLSDALLEVDRSDEAAEVLVRSAEVSHRDGDGELAAELLCKAAEIDPDVTERVGGMTTAVEDPTGGETPADSAEAAALDPGGGVVAEIRSSLEELVLEPPASRAPDGSAVPEVGTGEVPETGTDGLLEDLISTGVGKKQESRSPEIDFGTIELGGQEEGDLLPAPEGEPPGLLDGLMHTSDVAGSQPDERAPAGNLADPVSATREAVEAEQWTAAARRVEEWLQLDSQSGAAAEKLVEISEALQDVNDAIEFIAHLNPAPGGAFSSTPVPYVIPDIVVEKIDGRFEVRLEESEIPPLYVSRLYRNMVQDKSTDRKTRVFIRKKIQAARWLIESIEQRRTTLVRVATAIVDAQKEFIEKGPLALAPLKMQNIADEVGVHVSTVGRAIKDKYMQCPAGIFPIKFLFTGGTTGVDGHDESWKSIKVRIERMIAKEDKSKPLSDKDIADAFAAQGIQVKRRTVAKYREAMGIPSSRRRRQY